MCEKFHARIVSTLVWQAHRRVHILYKEQIVCSREPFSSKGLIDLGVDYGILLSLGLYFLKKNKSKTNTPGKPIPKMFLSSKMLCFFPCVHAIDVMKCKVEFPSYSSSAPVLLAVSC